MGSLKEDAVLVGRAKRAMKGIADGFAWWESYNLEPQELAHMLTKTPFEDLTDDDYAALMAPAEPASDEPDES